MPAEALLEPVVEPPRRLVGRDEVLQLHELELPGAEDEVLRGDLVAEGLAHLGDPEGRLLARGALHVGEVREHALGGLGPQVRDVALVLDGPRVGLEHEVERPGLGEVASSRQLGQVPSIWSARQRSLQLRQSTIGSVKFARCPEASQIAGGGQDRRVEAHHVVAVAGPSSATRRPSRCAAGARRAGRSRRSSGTRRRARRRGRRSHAPCTGSRPCRTASCRWSLGHGARDYRGAACAPSPSRRPSPGSRAAGRARVSTTRSPSRDDEVAERVERRRRRPRARPSRVRSSSDERLEAPRVRVERLGARRRVAARGHELAVALGRPHVPRPRAAEVAVRRAAHARVLAPGPVEPVVARLVARAAPSWRSPRSGSPPRSAARRPAS